MLLTRGWSVRFEESKRLQMNTNLESGIAGEFLVPGAPEAVGHQE
jgi:hypothetical protein